MSFLPYGSTSHSGWAAAFGGSMLLHGGLVMAALSTSVSLASRPNTTPERSPDFVISLEILDVNPILEAAPATDATPPTDAAEPLAPANLQATAPDAAPPLLPGLDQTALAPGLDQAALAPDTLSVLPDRAAPPDEPTTPAEPALTPITAPIADTAIPEATGPTTLDTNPSDIPDILATTSAIADTAIPEATGPTTLDTNPSDIPDILATTSAIADTAIPEATGPTTLDTNPSDIPGLAATAPISDAVAPEPAGIAATAPDTSAPETSTPGPQSTDPVQSPPSTIATEQPNSIPESLFIDNADPFQEVVTSPLSDIAVGIAPTSGTAPSEAVPGLQADVSGGFQPDTSEPLTRDPKTGNPVETPARQPVRDSGLSGLSPSESVSPTISGTPAISVSPTESVSQAISGTPASTALTDLQPQEPVPAPQKTKPFAPTELAALAPQPQTDLTPDPSSITGTTQPVPPDTAPASNSTIAPQRTVTPIVAPTRQQIALGQLIRNIRITPPPPCSLALPRQTAGGRIGLSLIGNDPEQFDPYARRIVAGLDMPTTRSREIIDTRQCAALDAFRQSRSYPASRIGLTLDDTRLASGDVLSGRVLGAGGLFLTVLLIDDNGVVHDLARFARTDGNALILKVPVARAVDRRQTRQILLVVGSNSKPLPLGDADGRLARDVFAALDRKSLDEALFGLVTFDVR